MNNCNETQCTQSATKYVSSNDKKMLMMTTVMTWISSITAALLQQLSDSASLALPCYINTKSTHDNYFYSL